MASRSPKGRGSDVLPFPLTGSWASSSSPEEEEEVLVSYILLAEFDLTTGSTLRHQFPKPVPNYEPDFFAEKMLPEGAHNRETDTTFFLLNPQSPTPDELVEQALQRQQEAAACSRSSEGGPTTGQAMGSGDKPSQADDRSAPFLYCMNIVRTKHDASARRGAVVKALAVCSRYPFVQVLRPPLELALDEYFSCCSSAEEEDGLGVLRRLYADLNAIAPSALPRPTPVERALMHRGLASRLINEPCPAYTPQAWVYKTHVEVGGGGPQPRRRLPLSLPLHLSADEVGERCLVQLLRTFRHDTMRIYNAVLTGKRVIFSGYNHAAGDVCKFVLAAASLVSPPLIGTIRRTCPYTNLSDLSFLELPCFIAGVTNPMFESHEEWWDLLCVLDLPQGTGRCYAPGERAEEEKPSLMGERKVVSEEEEHDNAFIARVLSGCDARLGEDWVRGCFMDFTQTLVDFALDGSGQSSGLRVREEVRKAVKANEGRIRALRKVPEFASVNPHPWKAVPNLPVRGDILRSHVRMLELQSHITEPEAERIFSDLSKALQSEVAVQTFLACLPEARQGGLLRISSALFHPSQNVRMYACLLLQRLETFESTRPAVFALNKYLLMAYKRVTEEMTAT